MSGVAPLAVFFDASATTATATTRPFHDLEYRWDFGDPAGATTWSVGSRAGFSSKNSATGPVAAHVFEQAGTYIVSLTVADGTNTVSNSCVQIEVSDPDAVFANTNTRCFSNNADFTGCPAGAQQVPSVTTMANVLSHAATNRRLLLHRGHAFTTNGTGWSAQGPGSIGAFGTGAKPIIRSSVTDVTIINFGDAGNPTFADWRVMDLEIDCQAQNLVVGIQPSGNARHMLFLRMAIHDCEHGYISYYAENVAINANFPWQQIAIVDTTITNSRQYGIFLSTRNFALLGSTVDTTATEHVMRHPYIQKSVISNNTLANTAPSKHVIKLVSQNFPATGAFNEQIVISDNKIVASSNGAAPITIGPQDAAEDERVRDVIYERNWSTGGGVAVQPLVIWAQRVTVRNNVMDLTGSFGFGIIGIQVARRGIEPAPADIGIYNNTFYTSNPVASGDFVVVSLSSADNVRVVNNLAYAPNAVAAQPPFIQTGGSTNVTQSNNTTPQQLKATFPGFVNATPTVPADFDLGAGSYAINTGTTAPVFSDFFRRGRTVGGANDKGAMEKP